MLLPASASLAGILVASIRGACADPAQRVEAVDDAIRIMDRRWSRQGRLLPAIAAIGDGWRSLIYTGMAEKESNGGASRDYSLLANVLIFKDFA